MFKMHITKQKRITLFLLSISICLVAILIALQIHASNNAKATKVPVLAYHKLVTSDSQLESSIEVDAATFEKQMKYLHDKGFKTLTPDEFYQWHKGEIEIPKKSVLITFDDGYYSMYYIALPILKKYDISATVFCIGKYIQEVMAPFDANDSDRFLSADVINEIRKTYPKFYIESHTYDMHTRVNGKKPAYVFTHDQVVDDCKKMDVYGFKYLAYPWGSYSDTMQKAIRESGYKMAFAYNPYYYALRSNDAYAVDRIKISGGMSMRKFKKIVNGVETDYDNPDAPENK